MYKSAYKNAMRVARTETNMAYRKADNVRWQQMDFVVGQRISLSKKHPCEDICDDLAGEYPKSFVFTGWHPQCFCYVTPILGDEDEMAKITDAFLDGKDYEPQFEQLEKYPKGFQNWVKDHKKQIEKSIKQGKEPYFIKDNMAVVDNILTHKNDNLIHLKKVLSDGVERYDQNIPTDNNGDIDIDKYKEKIADLLKSAGCFFGENITNISSLKTKQQLDKWYSQALKFADISGLDKITSSVNKILLKGGIKGSSAVKRQGQKFLIQHYDYMKSREYIKAQNALLGYKNLYDLSVKNVDFSKVSMLMPKELMVGSKWLGVANNEYSKAFFDLFNDYVPVTIKNTTKSNTFYDASTRSVTLNMGDNRYKVDVWYRFKSVYHEFGHALDSQLDLCNCKDILDTIKRYDKIMKQNSKFNVINKEARKIKDFMMEKTISAYEYADTMLDYYADKLLQGINNEKLYKRLGIVKERIDAGQRSALSDTLSAISKGEHGYGHSKKYWESNKDFPAMEFIAHCFENKYAGNELFRCFYRQLYDDMINALDKALYK